MSSIIDNNVQGIVLVDGMQDPGNGEQLDTVTTSLKKDKSLEVNKSLRSNIVQL